MSNADLLHRDILRWCWTKGWSQLRDVQEKSIPPILEGKKDVVISASTASGKTEAAFLPLLSILLTADAGNIVYVAPLKALINDQEGRINDMLGDSSDFRVVPWHGDVSSEGKAAFKKNPKGVLLITPESLEAIMMKGSKRMFSGTHAVIIDEFHSFVGTERGMQLLSLLHRMEKRTGRNIPRVALSATIGDMRKAAEHLRPGAGQEVELIDSGGDGRSLLVSVRGYLSKGDDDTPDVSDIAKHLYSVLRGTNNLVFPTRKTMVETMTDALRDMCEKDGVPNEFFAHHGSLSKEIREETESALKNRGHPSTAICTSTLEMGIDIGDVRSVTQIGPPPSVAALRQRLGRSGRRDGDPAILRGIQIEAALTEKGLSSADRMRIGTVRTIATIELLLENWFEPPPETGMHLSTAVQQLLSLIIERGGVSPATAWDMLCVSGPFRSISSRHFAGLLRGLAEKQVIEQSPDGTLMLNTGGEQMTTNYEFFAAFSGKEEVDVAFQGRHLGTIEPDETLAIGSLVILAGRRWEITGYDPGTNTASVIPAGGGKPPKYGGGAATMHDRVAETMFSILSGTDDFRYVHESAAKLLKEGRHEFKRLKLHERMFVDERDGATFWHWKGTKIGETIALALVANGCEGKVMLGRGYIQFAGLSSGEVQSAILGLPDDTFEKPDFMTNLVLDKNIGKWDMLLPLGLMNANYASERLDLPGTKRFIEEAMDRLLAKAENPEFDEETFPDEPLEP